MAISKTMRLAALLLLALATSCQAQKWVSSMDGALQTPPLTEEELGGAKGTFAIWATADGLQWELEVTDITNLTMGHIHIGNASVAAGDVAVILVPTADENQAGNPPMLVDPVTGSYKASGLITPADFVLGAEGYTMDEFLNLADSEGLYTNMHTTEYPIGAIRGQIMPAEEVTTTADLNGANQVPTPVDTAATATFTMTSMADGTYSWTLDIMSIDNLTMGHIHVGNASEAGDVAVVLLPVGGKVVDGAPPMFPTPMSGDLNYQGTFTDADILIDPVMFREYLRYDPSEHFYVNLHTTEYSGGVIRGQLTYTYTEEGSVSPAEAPAAEEPMAPTMDMPMEAPAPMAAPLTSAAAPIGKAASFVAAALFAALLL